MTKKIPKQKCNDKNCPFHGSLKCRGRIFTGIVMSVKMQKTATIGWSWKHYLPKYERYETRRTRVKAHNPKCIDAKEGDIVKISECRPLSKTKNFVVIEKIGKEKGFKEKIEAIEEAKHKKKPEKLEVLKKAEEKKEEAIEERNAAIKS